MWHFVFYPCGALALHWLLFKLAVETIYSMTKRLKFRELETKRFARVVAMGNDINIADPLGIRRILGALIYYP